MNTWAVVLESLGSPPENPENWAAALEWLGEWAQREPNRRRGVLVASETLAEAARSSPTTSARAVSAVLRAACRAGLVEQLDVRLNGDEPAVPVSGDDQPSDDTIASAYRPSPKYQECSLAAPSDPPRKQETERRPLIAAPAGNRSEPRVSTNESVLAAVRLGRGGESPQVRLVKSNRLRRLAIEFDEPPDARYARLLQAENWEPQPGGSCWTVPLDDPDVWKTQFLAERFFLSLSNAILADRDVPPGHKVGG